MWPWTHALFGYACYSLAVRTGFRRRPTDIPAVIAVFAAVLPDIIDKPLAWTVGITSSGYGPAHSLLIGAPIAVVIGALLWRAGRREAGLGFLIGFGSHLVGDLLFQLFDDGELVSAVVLWPVTEAGSGSARGLVYHFLYFLHQYVWQIRSGQASTYLAATMALAVGVILLWLVDGTPGVRLLTRRD